MYISALNLILYSYSFTNRNIEEKSSKKNFYHKYYYNIYGEDAEEYYIQNKGLSCQYMTFDSSEDILVCFFVIYKNIYYYLVSELYSLTDSSIDLHNLLYPYYFPLDDIKCIKSTPIFGDISKSFICFYLTNGEGRCFLYDINSYMMNLFMIFGQILFVKMHIMD